MALLRKHCKYYILILSVALGLAQYTSSVHDQSHQHSADDCIICKVVETGANDVHVVEAPSSIYYVEKSLYFSVRTIASARLNYSLPFTRAPPIS